PRHALRPRAGRNQGDRTRHDPIVPRGYDAPVEAFAQQRPENKVLQVRDRESVERYEQPALAEEQRRVLEELRANGLAVTTFDRLIGDGALWNELEAEMQAFCARAEKVAPRLDRPK